MKIDLISSSKKGKENEEKFWDLVKLADWPNKDSGKVKIMYRKMLSKKQSIDFRITVNKAFRILDELMNEHPEISDNLGTGDDGYCDLLHHIIGLGKEQFYEYYNNPKLIEKLAHSGGYEESFAYCIPYEDDYKENNMYSIENVIKTAKEAVKEIQLFDKMDTWGEEGNRVWLKEIHNEMSDIMLVLKMFLNHPTVDNLKVLVDHKDFIDHASAKIEKFFEKNYMELPRKFTADRENGSNFNGMCVALFNNTVGDAEDVLEYLKN